jgi:malto-oligosyltrehalose trehalohydrolase
MMHGAWRLPFGANLISPNRTHFKIWAPAQRSMSVRVEGIAQVPLQRNDEGWFEGQADCGAGARYCYVLENGTTVPDPASRAQDSDVHGASIVVDPGAYPWREENWRGRPWHEAVIYELHAGVLGGFKGVRAELPRLASLGVTAVELMPIAEFPGARNWGYDGVLPFAPECSYGSPEELKSLVDAAHANGLMIFLDVVYNHFGPDGNYLGRYAPQTFRDDVTTPWGPAIDFRRSEVRRFFTENALYWLLEYRFDGLRFDAVHAITEQAWLDEMAGEVRRKIGPSRHVHLVLENDHNAPSHLERDFDAQWNDDGHHVLHILLTGEREGYYEDYAADPARQLARCLKEGFIYQGEPSAHRGGQSRGATSGHLPPTAFVLFLQNHDQIGNRAFGERLTSLANAQALEAAAALVLLCPQIPLLFMGEEIGSLSPFLFFTDHNPDLADAVREGRRKEFAAFPQFSDPNVLSQLPDPNAFETFARSKPDAASPSSTGREQLYRRLLALRRQEIVPRLPGAQAVTARAVGSAAVVAHWRMGDGALLTIAVNLGQDAAEMPIHQGRVLFSSSEAAAKAADGGRLDAYTTIAVLGA